MFHVKHTYRQRQLRQHPSTIGSIRDYRPYTPTQNLPHSYPQSFPQ